MQNSMRRLFLAAVLATLVACGGGGGTFAGIDRLGVSNGTISGFGSIIVNGVEYQTNNANFSIDDGPGSQDDLQVGQVVTVKWSSTDNGVTFHADDVTYDNSLVGPILAGSIDLVAQTFVVLGQGVIVDSATSFDADIIPNSLDGLADGNIVRISGLLDSNGNIRATRIDQKQPGSTFEVHGTVASLGVNDTFVVNGLTVDYVNVVNPPPLANGDLVEVRGTLVSGTLLASAIQSEDQGSPPAEGTEAEVEGFVTRFGTTTDFDVSGVPVTTNPQTQVENGTLQSLALNVKVEVEGDVNASGVLVAKRISIRSGGSRGDSADVKLQADVDSVNAAGGTLVVAGIMIRVDDLATRLEDQRSLAPVRPFTLANVSPGDFVEVRGVAQPDNSVNATLLQREDPDTEGELRGPVGAAAIPNLTVLGKTVQTDGSTTFAATDGSPLSEVQFFNVVGPGDLIKVVFTQNASPPSTPILADEIEIESLN